MSSTSPAPPKDKKGAQIVSQEPPAPAIPPTPEEFYRDCGGVEAEILVPGIDHPVRAKRLTLDTLDPILYFDDENFRNAWDNTVRRNTGLNSQTQEEIAATLLQKNPALEIKFFDIGGPVDGPYTLPEIIEGQLRLRIVDGNTSHATMQKRRKYDHRSEKWSYVIFDPTMSSQDKALLTVKHCGELAKPWTTFGRAAKMNQLVLQEGLPEAEAAKRVGMEKKEFEKWSLSHKLHVRFTLENPGPSTDERFHTKITRFVDAGHTIATNEDYIKSYFKVLKAGGLEDTNSITGAKIREIFGNKLAHTIFENEGYNSAVSNLGYVNVNGIWKKPLQIDRSHKRATEYLQMLSKIQRHVQHLSAKDYAYLRGERENDLLKATNSTARCIANLMQTVQDNDKPETGTAPPKRKHNLSEAGLAAIRAGHQKRRDSRLPAVDAAPSVTVPLSSIDANPTSI